MIRSFKDKATEGIWNGEFQKHIPVNIQRQGYRKLLYLYQAESLDKLQSTPGNNLKALGGNRSGQYSIRINRQWRICFYWDYESGNADNVEIVDYHK